MRRLPSFFALRAFEAAARLGGFTQAGEELHLTPSAISHQVRALETWFGRALFTRGVRKVTLTVDGRRLLDQLSPAFDQIEDACAELRPLQSRSELAVHCSPSFAAKWLGPRLPQFMAAHPSIVIRMSSSAEPADLAKSADIDVDIAYGLPPPHANVMVEPLGLESTVPMCSPRLLEGRGSMTPADVLRFTLIDSKVNPVQWTDWCKLNGLKLPTGARPSFDRGSMVIAAAVDGMGIALETTRFAQRDLERGDLVILDGPSFHRIERVTHFICYRKSAIDNERLIAFREWMKAQLLPAT
ncbi:LysR substrate-binding domain-containing protein [Variovorax sp. RTB1]|uniref:LysR substrate-binding domain-containing protein n=1 Tax=Variovorax sp. RTB1 TaxID=3048631 RepID=UPI002B23AEC9|nr:LysR substrate-binding domain-containing protein [Variovorax sp. RTB1]MEB0114382.1 LysR substrate-binding domain-containing protein [Variovorax sp. RTB1]